MINELKEKYFNLNDIKIYAKEIGEGPLVIMVHGWPESWYSWRHQLRPIADLGYKVLAIDVRGYGQSSKPYEVEHYDMLSLVGDIINIINAEDKVIIVDNSKWILQPPHDSSLDISKISSLGITTTSFEIALNELRKVSKINLLNSN